MSGEQRLSDGAIEDRDRASGTPAPALSVEEARGRALADITLHRGYHLIDSPTDCPTCKEALDDLTAAIRAESAEALRAATARAERLERVARETLAVHKAWGRLPPSMMEANANLERALSATEEGQA